MCIRAFRMKIRFCEYPRDWKFTQSHFHFKARIHMRCGSGNFAERCDFNEKIPIISNDHGQLQ